MSERDARVGLNEVVFREVNERIEQLAESFHLRGEPLDLVCECGDASCAERISMTHEEYEALRSDARLFAVYPGHVRPDVEELVEKRDGYDVIAKNEGLPAVVAETTDPRRD